MKLQFPIPAGKLLTTVLFSSFILCCKKSDSSKTINNTIWTGEYQEDGSTIHRPYSLEFMTGGAVILRNFYGDTTGTYIVEQNKVTINFAGISTKFSAIITDDNKLSQFEKLGSQHFTMLSGALNTATGRDLDNTIWKTSNGWTFTFLTGSQVNVGGPIYSYTRKAGALRFSAADFVVIMNDSTMEWTSTITRTLTKQP